MTTGNPSNFLKDDAIFGAIDLDDEFVTNSWLLEQFVGGALWTCGYNRNGAIGNGTNTSYSSPIQIGSLTNWKQISGGKYFTAAIKTDGTLWAWGNNQYGQLGNGTTVYYSSPIQIGSLTNWRQVSCGLDHIAAVKTDGTLWTCGYNVWGQLGNGTNTNSYSSPIQVGSLTNWKQVAANFEMCCAIKTDGTLWSWGYNDLGQLGNNTNGAGGSTNSYSSPVQVGSLTNWQQVAIGIGWAIAIKTDGTMWSWGSNSSGQLGIGGNNMYSSPVQVGSLTNWKQVACHQSGFAAVKTDGTLWTCGYNNYGQLGNGTSSTSSTNYSPIQVGTLTNWKQVACGGWNTFAIKTNGTLWACGYNLLGELGNGTRTSYSSPIQIGSLTNWKSVACGYGLVLSAITFNDLGT
jgi:alpha-tubulin suppressor-like RCC1 family protein